MQCYGIFSEIDTNTEWYQTGQDVTNTLYTVKSTVANEFLLEKQKS